MNQDYFATRFDAAAQKLQRALALCGRTKCSAKVRAELERDLGVVEIVGLHDTNKGIAAFKQAVADNPAVQLDPAFVTPEVRAAFNAAHGNQGSSTPAPAAQTELKVKPVSEQRVRRPVPVYVELSAGMEASEVRLYFRRSDEQGYRSTRMKRVGSGYGGLIPCDLVRHTGTIDYYVRAFDRDDQPVGHAGSDKGPFQVQILEEMDEPEPRWPGHAPPASCEAEHKPACESDADCASGHCGDDGQCVAKHASAASHGPSRFRLSISVAQDVAYVGGTDVCTEGSQLTQGYSCFRAAGSQYHGNPVMGRADAIGAGLTLATTRVLLGGDYLLASHFVVGARLGYVLRGGGPRSDNGKSFFPWHAEARLAYFLDKKAFNASGFSPFLFVSGGLAQVDAKNRVFVYEDLTKPPPASQIDNPPQQYLDAWRKMGGSFVAPGVGVYYALGQDTGLIADLKYLVMFPSSGTGASLSLGFAFGP